ncbi:3-deoxy-D-manno-octulosonic acid transferase [Thiomicrorhabdus sp. ZW0627]|uniref:3-deoxy-D-manno-octulosonic acid transferase n=1 Tax=Thiomicrorhabdus sp. ZW0627 TaxID=3039774 RepID=UPI002436FFD5|nr:3-deoxy-D-manno-octulosonic acid transferase [Thiomicrorhabdus sp. ZW0627]MDG6773640.1 3-deoxy-D-manno-octulosonic acid transferase [Thiomicrorhabdus sp. ZW0627]
MRLGVYRFLTTVALPLIAYSGWKRCKKHKSQCKQYPDLPPIHDCFASRFGRNRQRYQTGGIWIHAVSVGETRSIFPLLNALKEAHPDLPLTVTNGSTQGAIQALQFAPVEIQHQMIPYDFKFAVNRFLDQLQPKLVIMVETEIWPNLYQACSERDIPIVLVNARLKEKSFQAYKKWGGKMLKDALNQARFIAAQFPVDAQSFEALGAEPQKIKTLGNIKFDMEIPAGLLEKANEWKAQNELQKRFVWVAASTHADPNSPSQFETSEENKMLQAHRQLLKTHPDALLILVPRHADRFGEIAEQLDQSTFKWARRSQKQAINSDTQVYLADTVGELMQWFAACNAAFIGGSLVPFGGHNILEPAALNKPVISGPHFANLNALYQTFITEDAITLVDDSQALGQTLTELASNPELQKNAGERAHQAFEHNTGALKKLLAEIKPLLD